MELGGNLRGSPSTLHSSNHDSMFSYSTHSQFTQSPERSFYFGASTQTRTFFLKSNVYVTKALRSSILINEYIQRCVCVMSH